MASTPKPPQNVSRLIAKRLHQARFEIQATRELVPQHGTTIGDGTEDAVRELITALLPTNISLGSGFVVALDPAGSGLIWSEQLDLVVHDPAKPAWRVGRVHCYPAESVLMGMEVKTHIGSSAVAEKARRKMESLKRCSRSMGTALCLETDKQFWHRPLGVIVAGKSMASARVRKALGGPVSEIPPCKGCLEREEATETDHPSSPAQGTPPVCECRSPKLPDLYVALTGPTSTSEADGYVLGYREWYDGARRFGYSSHSRRAEGFGVDASPNWMSLMVCSFERLLLDALHISYGPSVPVDQYLGRLPNVDRVDCDLYGWQCEPG